MATDRLPAKPQAPSSLQDFQENRELATWVQWQLQDLIEIPEEGMVVRSSKNIVFADRPLDILLDIRCARELYGQRLREVAWHIKNHLQESRGFLITDGKILKVILELQDYMQKS